MTNAKPSKPIPICTNVHKLAAFEIATKLVDMCHSVDVTLDFKKVQNFMASGIKSQDPFSCNTSCWLKSGTTNMASCVENDLVAPYVNDFMKTTRGHGAKSVCATAKGW